MEGLIKEIKEIPERAKSCLKENQKIILPTNVSYIGMGSSYFAPLALFYTGANIKPQIASEYYYYLAKKTEKLGVLLSQSGESSETVWNLDHFSEVIAITNNTSSTLATSKNTKKVIDIFAGKEKFSSTKSYINTLIVLYIGLGIDPKDAVQQLEQNFDELDQKGKKQAQKISKYLQTNKVKGLYIIGSGPNIGTAFEGALTLSETTKFSWIGMPVAQYDHGPKETADNTIVVILNAQGKDKKRIGLIKKILEKHSNALVIEAVENYLPEELSPLTLIAQLNFLMNYLADEIIASETFTLGEKITRVSDKIK